MHAPPVGIVESRRHFVRILLRLGGGLLMLVALACGATIASGWAFDIDYVWAQGLTDPDYIANLFACVFAALSALGLIALDRPIARLIVPTSKPVGCLACGYPRQNPPTDICPECGVTTTDELRASFDNPAANPEDVGTFIQRRRYTMQSVVRLCAIPVTLVALAMLGLAIIIAIEIFAYGSAGDDALVWFVFVAFWCAPSCLVALLGLAKAHRVTRWLVPDLETTEPAPEIKN